jgi:hypothetical protein
MKTAKLGNIPINESVKKIINCHKTAKLQECINESVNKMIDFHENSQIIIQNCHVLTYTNTL